MKNISKLLLTVFLILFAFSCNVGLGEAVDLTAPVVEITRPEVAEAVPQTITVEGTAIDNIGVTKIQVTIDETNQIYQLIPGTGWQVKASDSWQNYANGTSVVEKTKISFTLDVEVVGSKSGDDITIITQAFDELGNEGKQSKDERLVTIDINAPAVTVNEPVLFADYSTAETNLASYSLQDNAVLSHLYNQDITISGYQKEESTLEKLIIYIDTKTASSVPANEAELTYSEGEVSYKKEFTGSGLRNWNFKISKNEFPVSLQTGSHLLRISSYSYDVAGNIESKVHGWFVYWNEADKPWLVPNFGYDDFTLAAAKKIYPTCSLLGQAYDDDGLRSVSIRTVLYDDSTNPATETEVSELTKIINLDGDDNPKYYAWSTYAISELGKFYVTVKCTDIYGSESEAITRYLEVDDITPPSITVESELQLPLDKTAFNISGYVEDDGGVKALAIIRTTGMSEQDEVKYLNGVSAASVQNPAWQISDSDISTGSKTENGHKIWILGDSTLGAKQYTSNGIKRSFNFSLDYQRDFSIKTDFTGKKLTTQSFIICAIDNTGLSRTQAISLSGDSTRPTLTFDEVVVYSSYTDETNNVVKESKLLSGETPQLQPFNREGGAFTDKVQLRGTFSDNSVYLSDIQLSWTDYEGTVTVHTNGNNWYTDPITPPDKTTAVISADIEDLGGNKTTVGTSFYVNGAVAQFLRITADKPDGYYNSGDILISLEFSKNVEFKGGTKNPELILSNGAIAAYLSGNKTSDKHVFKYTIGSTDNTVENEVLNVTEIKTYGHKWYDGSNPILNNSGAQSISGSSISSNLKVNRSIRIDTTKPYLKNLKMISSAGAYKAGKVLYISGTFNEEVKDITGLKLTFNTGKDSTETKATGPNSVLFKYEVQSTDFNTKPNGQEISVSSISYGSTKDRAGNLVDTTKNPTKSDFTGRVIDTKTPVKQTITLDHTISGSGNPKVLYKYDEGKNSVTVTIPFDTTETTGVRKYTTNYDPVGTNIWESYTGTGSKTLSLTDGEYNICAYQEDAAGNRVYADSVKFNIDADSGHILKSVKVNKPSGTYGLNEQFVFTLEFRNNIKVSNPKIKISIGASGKEISGTSVTSTTGANTLTFNYTAAAGDICTTKLQITELSGTFTDLYGNNIDSYVAINNSSVENFSSEKTIKIETNNPVVQAVTLTGQVLRIVFDQKITKGTTGEVELEMTDTYKAPPYFTKDQWSEYSASSIASYYESNTLGCSSTGVADLTEKYVLKFNYGINDSTLTTALKGLGAHKAKMSINSSDVSIDSSDSSGKTLKMDFGNKIPVKGAAYKVTIPANLVYNTLNNGSAASNTYTVILSGIENPVIRIEKKNEVIEDDGSITQPINANAKIDCQTPGATITYQLANAASNGITMVANGNDNVKLQTTVNNETSDVTQAPSHTLTSYGTASAPAETCSFPLTAGTNKDKEGCQIRIRAKASKTGQADTDYVYEQAMKTVIIFINRGEPSGYKYRCIRGGDQPQGAVGTPNFPFSWNTNEYDKIRTMTGDGNTDGSEYYWVTWKMTTTAFVGFLAASSTMPDDANINGPKDWWWASCGWVPNVSEYPIYPGEHTTCDANGVLTGKNGGFGFLDKHKQGR